VDDARPPKLKFAEWETVKYLSITRGVKNNEQDPLAGEQRRVRGGTTAVLAGGVPDPETYERF